ncbi:MAG: hypothetical protein R2844_21615 [Caldilineales bacterium]
MRRHISVLAVVAAGLLVVSACAPVVTSPESPASPIAEAPATTSTSHSTPAVATVTLTEPLVAVSPTTAMAATPTEPPASATVEPETGQQKTVTPDDQGQTIDLLVGQRFLLALGDGYTWQVEVSDENVVSRVRNIAVVRGAQGVYEGVNPGTATLSAAGDPLCRQSKPPCGMPSIAFQVTIVVT